MAIPLKNTASFTPAPKGAAVARCTQIIDLGTQLSKGFKGRPDNHKRKIRISFELPFVKMTEGDYKGQPYVVGKRFTFSLHPKADLKKFLEAWFAREIDTKEKAEATAANMHKFIGQVAQVTIMHSEDGEYANIVSIGQYLGEKSSVPPMFNKPIYFELTKEGYKQEVFDMLSDRTKETIQQSPEWIALNGGPVAPSNNNDPHEGAPEEDDVPF